MIACSLNASPAQHQCIDVINSSSQSNAGQKSASKRVCPGSKIRKRVACPGRRPERLASAGLRRHGPPLHQRPSVGEGGSRPLTSHHHQPDIPPLLSGRPPLLSGRKPSGTAVIEQWKSVPNQLLRIALGTEPEGGSEIKIGYSLDGLVLSQVCMHC